MGQSPLSFTEIHAYLKCMKANLYPSEILLIRKMSEQYVSQSHNTDPKAKPSYVE